MTEHQVGCRPFTLRSFLSVARYDEGQNEGLNGTNISDKDDGEKEKRITTATNDYRNGNESSYRAVKRPEVPGGIQYGVSNEIQSPETYNHPIYDRRRMFIIEDQLEIGPASSFAMKFIKNSSGGSMSRKNRANPIALQEHAKKNFGNILRFMSTLSSARASN